MLQGAVLRDADVYTPTRRGIGQPELLQDNVPTAVISGPVVVALDLWLCREAEE